MKISLGIFCALAASRFVPHPPNFTSLIALSFYVPAFFGLKYLPAVLISFILTDFFIGFHNTLIFTWGSVVLVGTISIFLSKTISTRIVGSIFGALIFYIITNFGVWLDGMYTLNLNGLITSYILALPFFGYTLLSTILFSALIETCFFFKKVILIKLNTKSS